MDALRQAFVDRKLQVNMFATNKAAARAAFAKTTPNMPPGQNAKARKAAADKRKAAATTGAGATPGTKPSDTTKLYTKK
jgi:hypothetical protein